MRKRKRSHLTPLQSGLSAVLGEQRLQELAAIGHLRRGWKKVVGPVLAQHSEPLNIEAGCLHIAVDHPAMAQQIRFLQQEIREACFRLFRIKNISNTRTRMQPGAGIRSTPSTQTPARDISLQDKKIIAAEIHSVRDKTLRLAMFEARINQLRYPI